MGDWIDVKTQNNLHYIFLPQNSGAVKLRVKATNDAHIALTKEPFESEPMTEIHIGGWDNTKSIIRRDRCDNPNKAEAMTPGILNRDEFVDMWIRWQNSEVSAGLRGQPAFIKYLDPEPHTVNFMAVRTGWGSIGHWKIEVSPDILSTRPVKSLRSGHLRWLRKTRNDRIPKDAFIGGYENGEVLYIARAMHRASLIPGKFVPSQNSAYIGYGLQTTKKYECEILCGHNVSWERTKSDVIPPHAFEAGYAMETNREPLFIGRTRIHEHLIPGKVHTHYKTCYIPFEDKEIQKNEYEILVLPEELPDAVRWRQNNSEE